MHKVIEIATLVLAAYIFMFLFWKKLREDYIPSQIFTTSLVSLLGLFVFTFSLSKLNNSWWFWWAFLGSIIGLLAAIYKFNLKIFETLEAWIFAGLSSILLLLISKSLFEGGLNNYISLGYTILLYALYFYLNRNYKRFTWYKSGKVGFSGIIIFSIFFLTRFIVALFYPGMLSFVGQGELLLSGGLVIVAIVLYINLSRLMK